MARLVPRRRVAAASAIVALALVALLAEAGTMYRSVGADGRVVYSDTPPRDGRSAKRLEVESLPSTPVPDYVLRFRQQLLKNADRRAQAERQVDAAGVTLFTAQWCKYCRQAKAYLDEKGIAFREQDIDTDSGRQSFAILGGGGGIPLLVVDGRQTRGFAPAAYDALFAPGSGKR